MKNVSVLGSTGSIGKQTLEVAAANPDKIKIRALAAHTSDVLLEEQINIFQPDIAALSDEAAAERLKKTVIPARRKSLQEKRVFWKWLRSAKLTQF